MSKNPSLVPKNLTPKSKQSWVFPPLTLNSSTSADLYMFLIEEKQNREIKSMSRELNLRCVLEEGEEDLELDGDGGERINVG